MIWRGFEINDDTSCGKVGGGGGTLPFEYRDTLIPGRKRFFFKELEAFTPS